MKFAIGYQEPANGEEFHSIVEDYREHVAEVYFAWPGAASGRPALGKGGGLRDWGAQERLEGNLERIKASGVKLDLLLNATCYGGRAASEALESEILSVLERVEEVAGGVDIVTTSSIAAAWILKRHAPGVEVRSSVNMKVGSPEAMSYVAELFDSFHFQRDFQRDVDRLREAQEWCAANGKRLSILANSGCLHCCPGQLFHDNLVAHDAEVSAMKPLEGFAPHVCWSLFKDKSKGAAVLKGSWIRPEDLRHYAPLVDVVKLATRSHATPRMVIGAYAAGRFNGNLLDLFEPTFSMAFAPEIFDNAQFPPDWFAATSSCKRVCHKCRYCEETFRKVLRKVQPCPARPCA